MDARTIQARTECQDIKLIKMYKNKIRERTYRSWEAMKARCLNPKTNGYNRYGGAGITVCERWLASFDNFLEDMGNRPSKEHTIDRYPDKMGNYEPANCRWATREQQAANRKCTLSIEHEGENIPLIILAQKHNISPSALRHRIKELGWDINTALNTPIQTGIKWGFFGRKIKYIKSDIIFNSLNQLLQAKKIPIAKSTTNGLTKSVLVLTHAKYKSRVDILRGQNNPKSKQIEGTHLESGETKIFFGLKEAADYINGHKSLVANVISGYAKSHRKWKFKHI